MAMDWENVIKTYRDIYTHSKFSAHAEAMLELIPILQENESFTNIKILSSHATLCIESLPQCTQIRVWFWDEATHKIYYPHLDKGKLRSDFVNKYEIYYYHPDKGNSQKTFVSKTNIVETLESYLSELSKLD